ncbi:tetratricopeptide repeat protein 19 homolog, mitochondrial [Fopius arisanus]|uniref:Tetratricopeptide repeat protein 19 homolog, mitochondrial n=1 Tax=Fopius arisanus TaxID=64838 RepID=A0A9R1U245_9HYME|nr:PREDICTED: tetratricopeptide repeat protein 19 homolog, mitochondrial [Fopius arisanus]XP_011304361.1 PREDICTED: tetratricopeptide repeat protein 19 homolog, mitochondrial [Fopius arisanus]XP_011304362.1 PREDICTED: tetratricopeptide repeat protein 19 homolog, mitochondrial [Fopius arisanus]
MLKRRVLQAIFTLGRRMNISVIEKTTTRRFRYRDETNPLCPKGVIGGGLAFLGIFGFGKEDEELEPELITTIKRSILLIQRGEYKKAEQMLHVALHQAQTLQHYDGITYVYDVLANLAFEVGDVEKSKKLFVSVMQRLMSTGTAEGDMKMIHISLKLARLYEISGDPGKAENGYAFCLKHVLEQAKTSPEDEDVLLLWGMTLDWYGKFLLSQSRLPEALKCYQQAHKLCQQVHGDEHEQTVVLLNDLGTVYCLLGEYEKALGHLSDAILIGEKLPEMSDLSSIHVNIGNVYLKRSLYNEARDACTVGLKLAKKNNDIECQEQANACLAEVKKLLSQ